MKNTVRRPRLLVSGDGKGLVSHAGGVLLTRTAVVTGLREGLSAGLARWRAPRAVHDPGKMITDLALTLALGGDCLAGPAAPGADGGLVTVDIDATIVIAHSDKERAAPTWKHTFSFHPLAAFADHGPAGTGEPLAGQGGFILTVSPSSDEPAHDRVITLTASTQLHKRGHSPTVTTSSLSRPGP